MRDVVIMLKATEALLQRVICSTIVRTTAMSLGKHRLQHARGDAIDGGNGAPGLAHSFFPR